MEKKEIVKTVLECGAIVGVGIVTIDLLLKKGALVALGIGALGGTITVKLIKSFSNKVKIDKTVKRAIEENKALLA